MGSGAIRAKLLTLEEREVARRNLVRLSYREPLPAPVAEERPGLEEEDRQDVLAGPVLAVEFEVLAFAGLLSGNL